MEISSDTWLLRFEKMRPLTINKEREYPYQKRNQIVQEWRTAAYWAAVNLRLPAFAWVEIEAKPVLPNRQHVQDLGNCLPSVKAVVDGLVDYGMIPDDTDQWVRKLCFLPTGINGADPGLELTIIGHERRSKRWQPARVANQANARRIKAKR